MPKALTTCPSCGAVTSGGRCAGCDQAAERTRGSFRQRGYRRGHDKRFRPGVLERDVNCVLCIEQGRWTPATVADHWPLSRRELAERGKDPDDPRHGRGLCASCHGRETAANPDQAGGWNAR